jgi:nucleoside-diphosphate-sugar epimerase
MSSRRIFLTGGAGVLGGALIECLAGQYPLVCLTRQSMLRRADVETLRGDIREAHFGLGEHAFRALAGRIDWIVHAGAVTRLDGGEEEIHAVNCVGTRNVLALAELSGKPLYHISTAFTHPCDYFEGVMAATPYELSKRRAEALVRESGVPASIFRPSIVIGDAATGAMPNFQGLHTVLGLALVGGLPIVPSPPSAYVDVIARDVAARAIKAALDRKAIGDDYFVTSGAAAPRIAAMLELLEHVSAEHGRAFVRPRCMLPDIYERLIKPAFLPSIPGGLQPALLRASLMSRYACLRSPLPSSLPQLLGMEQCRERDPLQELHRSIDYLWPRLASFRRGLKTSAGAPRRAARDEREPA